MLNYSILHHGPSRSFPAGDPFLAGSVEGADILELGHGKDYRYAHDEPDGFAAGASYLPDGMPEPDFYQPVPRGLEIRIGERLAELRRRNTQAGKPPDTPTDAG